MEGDVVREAGAPLVEANGRREQSETSVEPWPDRDLPGRLDLAQPVVDQENLQRRGADHPMNDANAASRPCIPSLGQKPHVDQGYRPGFTPAPTAWACSRLAEIIPRPAPPPPQRLTHRAGRSSGASVSSSGLQTLDAQAQRPATTQSRAALQE